MKIQVLLTMRPESGFWIAPSNGVTIFQNDVIVNFFDIGFLLLSDLVTGPSFVSISSLVLQL